MNTIIKESMLLLAATLITLSVSAQTDELWLDRYENKYVIDTLAADSIEAAKNAAYNAERRERERREYVTPFEKKIATIDQMVEIVEKSKSKSLAEKLLETAAGVNENNLYRGLFANYMITFANDKKVTTKDRSKLEKGRIPKDFIERVLQPQKDSLQNDISKFEPSPDIKKYDWRSMPRSFDIPKKQVQIHTRIPNPDCRDNYFNGNFEPSKYVYRNNWDEAQQSTGWEWVNEKEMEYNEVFYPEHLEYYTHFSHPEYRFVRNKKMHFDLFAYDEIGKLIRVSNVLGDKIPYDLKDVVMGVICKGDFLANKYDINKADKKTLVALRIRFGITKGVDERYEKYKNIYAASIYSMMFATTLKEYRSALAKRDEAMKVLQEYVYKTIDGHADRYIEQLKKDHSEDLKYLYKIERIDNTTFKIYYLNDKLECGCIVLMKWFSSDPYNSGYEIELLPCETITIRK